MVPLLLGVAPFGLVAGAAAVETGFPPSLAVAMSVIVFAGAAQLAVVDLVGNGAAPAVVVATAVVVNLRYLIYSASIAPYFRSFGRGWRGVLGYLLTDHAFALSVTRYESDDPIAGRDADPAARKWFYFGAAIALWVTWIATTVVGVVVGAKVPPGWSLEFAVPLTFLALLAPTVEDRTTGVAAVVAGGVAVGTAGLPLNLGLPVGALAGVLAGATVDAVTKPSASNGDDADPGGNREDDPAGDRQ